MHSLLRFNHNEQHKVTATHLQKRDKCSAFGVAEQRMQHLQILQDLAELEGVSDRFVGAGDRVWTIAGVANGHDKDDVEKSDELTEIVEN